MGAEPLATQHFDREQWQRILYYDQKIWGQDQSLVVDAKFFVTSGGHKDELAELAGFRHLVQQEIINLPKQDQGVICRFPWRYTWLKRVGLITNLAPRVEERCPTISSFLKATPLAAASIIFSSQYMGNPASYFGHTFLLLKQEHVLEKNYATMLDLAVGFSAVVNTPELSLAYAWRGLTGGFKGYFTIDPFFMKVQEYNFLEQRDLWEYEIKLNQQQIRDLLMALWEIKDIGIPYYYHSTNCTAMLQKLLAATDSRFAPLAQKFWTSPLSFVRKLEDAQLISEKVLRPSMYNQCLHKSQELTPPERHLIFASLKEGALQKMQPPISLSQWRRMLDVFADYIDYQERLAGNRQSANYGSLRHEILVARSSLGPGEPEVRPNNGETKISGPEKAHHESLFSTGLFVRESENLTGAIIKIRPSFHEFGEPNIGIGRQNAIALLGVEAHLSDKYAEINKFTLISMSSHPFYTPLLDLWSWEFAVGTDTLLAESQLLPTRNQDFYVRLGGGLTLGYHSQSLIVNLIPFVIAGNEFAAAKRIFASSGFLSGIRWRPFAVNANESLELALEWQPSWLRFANQIRKRTSDFNWTATWSFKSDIFAKIQWQKNDFQREGEVSVGYFF